VQGSVSGDLTTRSSDQCSEYGDGFRRLVAAARIRQSSGCKVPKAEIDPATAPGWCESFVAQGPNDRSGWNKSLSAGGPAGMCTAVNRPPQSRAFLGLHGRLKSMPSVLASPKVEISKTRSKSTNKAKNLAPMPSNARRSAHFFSRS
jgi:hypothetical protein